MQEIEIVQLFSRHICKQNWSNLVTKVACSLFSL